MNTPARRVTAALALACLLGGASAAGAQSPGPYPSGFRYDPRLQFQTLTVGRFDLYFHKGAEPLAARLAALIPEVAAEVEARFGAPRGRVGVILVDQTDLSNGWATIIPYNLIELGAVPPEPQGVLGNLDDWLELVFAHEYVHVVHLEKSGGWLGAFRHLFGRVPIFYPNVTLPFWAIEGIATHQESAITGRGRVPAGDFRLLLDRAAAAGRFEPLRRASQPIVDWPSGTIPYLYGAYFHEYLAERFGEESLARLADETARRLPYTGTRAFRTVFGHSLGALWADFAADTLARARARDLEAADSGRERLTHHGFRVETPVFAGGRLFYSLSDPHGFPAIYEWREGARPRQVARRVGGNRLSAAGDLLVFDQLEFVRSIDLQSDLYAVPIDGGSPWRLTHGARAAEPDVSPDGRTIACVVQQTDRRALATLPLPVRGAQATPNILVSEADVEFNNPRWSPDGRTLVAERRALGGPSELVIVDVETRRVRPLVASRPARNVTPAWSPDGQAIYFASDRDGGAFRLHTVDVTSGAVRRIDAAGPGAQSPAVGPDGRLVFVGYTEDGYDIFAVRGGPAEAVVPTAPAQAEGLPQALAAAPVRGGEQSLAGSQPYTPWATLTPRFWLPVISGDSDDLAIGATTAGYDALGRHAYSVSAAWALQHQRPRWEADYAYTRWRTTLFGRLSGDVANWRDGAVESREADAGAIVPVRRVRWASAMLASYHLARDQFACATCTPAVDRTFTRSAVRAGWALSNARGYGYSISPEEGGAVTVTTELARRGLGADADAGAAVLEARGYLRAMPRHGVLAARVGVATAWGEAPLRRRFSASGSGSQGGGFGVGRDVIGLLRGVPEGEVAGHHAVSANLDYRFPIAWIQRGVGTFPVMLRTVHGAVFVDMANAWDTAAARPAVRRTYGVELSADTAWLYALPLTFTAGAAWRDAAAPHRGWAAFARVGRAF